MIAGIVYKACNEYTPVKIYAVHINYERYVYNFLQLYGTCYRLRILMPDLENAQKLTVIVHAPLGVMGDMSGAARVIECIHSQYPNILIDFIVFVESQDVEKIKKFVPRCVNILRFIKLPHQRTHSMKGLDQAENILSNTDAIIFFATYRFLLGSDDLESLSRYHKPTIFLSDYDRHIKGLNVIVTHNTPICYENIGLGKGELGVFNPLDDNDTRSTLASITSPSDMLFKEFLLKLNQNDTQEQIEVKDQSYQIKHDLYLGYFSLIKNKGQTSKNSLGHPVFFIEDCIKRSIKNNRHHIDIIIPIVKEESEATRGRNIKAVIQYFESLFSEDDLKFEFYYKTLAGRIRKANEYGSGKTQVRIINGFPFAPKTFQCLLNVSEPYCMLTGNQSLVEGIFHHKICLYQIMQWNRRFYHELVQLAAKVLGSKSLWGIFLALQIVDDKTNKITAHKKITKLLLEHEPKILVEGKIFQEYLQTHCNLNEALPDNVIPILFNQKKYVEKAIVASRTVSFEYLTKLAKICPESKAYILNHVFQSDCFQPFLTFEQLEGDSIDRAEGHSLMPNERGQYEIKAFTDTYSELLTSNKKIDALLTKNIEKLIETTKGNDNLSALLADFSHYMVQHETRYCEYYPKLCRLLSQLYLSESAKRSDLK